VSGQVPGVTEGKAVMVRKWTVVLAVPVLGALVLGWRDIRRFAKIKMLSAGAGHPEYVPASGHSAYPKRGGGAADGHGDFDSGSRGGPARS